MDSERTPLIDHAGIELLKTIREHPHAPRWNYAVGDRLIREDLPALDHFRQRLGMRRESSGFGPPSPSILQRVSGLQGLVPHYDQRISSALDLEREWELIPTTCRDEFAETPWDFVPIDEDLERLVIYRTAGTTGHPIEVPHHPRAIGCYIPLIERALEAYGVELTPTPRSVVCFLVSAQVKTYTYSTVLSAWKGAGFAKINVRSGEWANADSLHRYFEEFGPQLVTGEPVVFSELLARGVAARPKAMVSTSLAMPAGLKRRLSRHFQCPIIEWYSLVETGPIGYTCSQDDGYHLLPHDIHVEVLRPDGSTADPGERGEITITGGRNPYLPLLRYRTGDWGHLDHDPCACGDPTVRIRGLEGRKPVLFRASDGTPVGAVDISRLLREFPLYRHDFEQREDRSCTLLVHPRPDGPPPDLGKIGKAMGELMGDLPIEVRIDARLGEPQEEKSRPYRSALRLEE